MTGQREKVGEKGAGLWCLFFTPSVEAGNYVSGATNAVSVANVSR